MAPPCASGASADELSGDALATAFAAFVRSEPRPRIILGTQSCTRRAVVDALAKEFGFEYSCITADIDEQAIRRDDPAELVRVLAHAKAAAIVEKLRVAGDTAAGLLITCDQVWPRAALLRKDVGRCRGAFWHHHHCVV